MITVFVGHRGSGKTSLLERIKQYDPTVETIDLDAYITSHEGMSVSEIFRKQGEAAFRKLERYHFGHIIIQDRRAPLFIAVGAGFEWDGSHGVRIVWVRRPTDHLGRILLERPRLDPHQTQLETYRERFQTREQRYDQMSHEEVTIPEGWNRVNAEERAWFSHTLSDVGGILTLLPKHFAHAYTWYWFLGKRLAWGLDAFEVRDDLVSPEMIQRVFESVPSGKTILSYRSNDVAQRIPPKNGIRWDWDINLGPCPFGKPSIVSMHDRKPGEAVGDVLRRLETEGNGAAHVKAAIEIFNFEELMTGHAWALRDVSRRSFLPRSPDGRWSWYRLLNKGRMQLNFFREGVGSSTDQPCLFDWLRTPQKPEHFAAVLGSPVVHSLTPATHHDFFSKRDIPVFSIRVTEDECENGALEVLCKLGLTHVAVTSPLKKFAFRSATVMDGETRKTEAVNTLWRNADTKVWHGANTDTNGFASLFQDVDSQNSSIAVYGAGALMPTLKRHLPRASLYGARCGTLKDGPGVTSPEILVWASHHSGETIPSTWKPKRILDLSYRQDSPALDYAEKNGISYSSGLVMFFTQAEGQQKFWESHEC